MTEPGRPRYSDRVKDLAKRMVLNEGRRIADVARELQIPKGTVSGWVRTERQAIHTREHERARLQGLLNELRTVTNALSHLVEGK
jgi:transposase-like protein